MIVANSALPRHARWTQFWLASEEYEGRSRPVAAPRRSSAISRSHRSRSSAEWTAGLVSAAIGDRDRSLWFGRDGSSDTRWFRRISGDRPSPTHGRHRSTSGSDHSRSGRPQLRTMFVLAIPIDYPLIETDGRRNLAADPPDLSVVGHTLRGLEVRLPASSYSPRFRSSTTLVDQDHGRFCIVSHTCSIRPTEADSIFDANVIDGHRMTMVADRAISTTSKPMLLRSADRRVSGLKATKKP